MIVHRLLVDSERYGWFGLRIGDDAMLLDLNLALRKCTSLTKNWTPIDLELLSIDERQRLRNGDIIKVHSTATAINQRTKDTLSPFFNQCELLPVQKSGEAFSIINPLVCAECVDLEKSERFSLGTPKPKLVLRPESIPIGHFFRIKRTFGDLCLATYDRNLEHFLDEHDLVGAVFEVIWKSEYL